MIYLGNTPVGIADKGLGSFTMHKTITVTPSANSEIEFTNPFNVAPKLVIVTDEDLTAGNKIQHCVVSVEAECGAYKYTSGTSGTGGSLFLDDYETASTTNARAYLGADKVHIHQATGTRTWASGNEYTVDIYA